MKNYPRVKAEREMVDAPQVSTIERIESPLRIMRNTLIEMMDLGLKDMVVKNVIRSVITLYRGRSWESFKASIIVHIIISVCMALYTTDGRTPLNELVFPAIVTALPSVHKIGSKHWIKHNYLYESHTSDLIPFIADTVVESMACAAWGTVMAVMVMTLTFIISSSMRKNDI